MRFAKWIGGIVGMGIALTLFVYVPMKRNLDECGRVTLCTGH